jgi:hypothetical protein
MASAGAASSAPTAYCYGNTFRRRKREQACLPAGRLPHSIELRRGAVWSAAACRRFRGRYEKRGALVRALIAEASAGAVPRQQAGRKDRACSCAPTGYCYGEARLGRFRAGMSGFVSRRLLQTALKNSMAPMKMQIMAAHISTNLILTRTRYHMRSALTSFSGIIPITVGKIAPIHHRSAQCTALLRDKSNVGVR